MREIFFFVLFVSLWCIGSFGATDEDGFILYTDIRPANTSESLQRIRNAPIVHYKFKYDSLQDRSQMGVIGPDAQRWFPESIDVVPSYSFSRKDKSKPPNIVTNFPVVDKNVLFMHGLAAIQDLINQYDELSGLLLSLDGKHAKIREEYAKFLAVLNEELDIQSKQELLVIQNEKDLALQKIQLEISKAENERLDVKKQIENDHILAEYEAELIRQRLYREEQMANENAIYLIQLERELSEKRSSLQQQSILQFQQLKQKQLAEMDSKRLESEKEKILAEIESKALQDRANEEIAIRRIQIQSKHDTERMVAGITAVSAQVAGIAREVLSKPKQLAVIVFLFLLLVASYYFIREFAAMVRQVVQSKLGQPVLVRETSRKAFWSVSAWGTSARPGQQGDLEEEFRDIILSQEDKSRVLNLALATKNTNAAGAPFRHVLLHGPPGTGKTLVARRLAQCSGLEYAIMSGGDVAPLGEEAVNQLHNLFAWAQKSASGLLIFIDEAEAFLSSRAAQAADNQSSVHVRNALNALLYQTGAPSQQFMLVLATNRPEDLDRAVLDRVDVSIHISLPALAQRAKLVELYMSRHLLNHEASENSKQGWFASASVARFAVDKTCSDEDNILQVAKQLHGFSGREISKLFVAARYAVILSSGRRMSWEMLQDVVATKIAEHHAKAHKFRNEDSEPYASAPLTARLQSHVSVENIVESVEESDGASVQTFEKKTRTRSTRGKSKQFVQHH